jgi:hypothetical protein
VENTPQCGAWDKGPLETSFRDLPRRPVARRPSDSFSSNNNGPLKP